jgi:glutathione S-transferase
VSDHYTVADISALVSIDFVMAGKVMMPDELVHARRWYAQVSARPSAGA